MSSLAAILAALRGADLLVEASTEVPEVSGVAVDSRRVEPGALFCAVRGVVADGHDYISEAQCAGAVAALVESRQPVSLPQILVRDGRQAAAVAATAWYERPGDRLRLIGVTGTNGKSTTVLILRHLRSQVEPTVAIGTLGAVGPDGGPIEVAGDRLTTPGPIELQQVLTTVVQARARGVAMEVSSHALEQDRVAGLSFAAAIYTNLTRDHLDYHATIEQYRTAKFRLATHLAKDGLLVVNTDDPAWNGIPFEGRRITYGRFHEADVRAESVTLSTDGSTFDIVMGNASAQVLIPHVGAFNVINALGAAACAIGLGQPFDEVVQRLASAPRVPGRMERLASQPCTVFRDYASSPDAFERVLREFRAHVPGRLIVVFGMGGDRDRGKRPIVGRIAAGLADYSIITTDNPRTEDPERIFRDIEDGLGQARHERIVDRREAIERAFELARPDDCILLVGKGHETYQIIGTERIPFDEKAIVAGLVGRTGEK